MEYVEIFIRWDDEKKNHRVPRHFDVPPTKKQFRYSPRICIDVLTPGNIN